MKTFNTYLLIGGICSFAVAVLHIAIIIGGGNWYRFFGAGEEMALMSESGSYYPAILTFVIVIVFTIWSIYAFSGAGLIRKMPLLRLALVVISSIYIIRGLGIIPVIVFSESTYIREFTDSKTFMLVSSLISLVFGLFYMVGTVKSWSSLSKKAHNITL